ncbi:MAG: M20/M25/M40 family metallo-hydrolase [Spirochaetota bacterium]
MRKILPALLAVALGVILGLVALMTPSPGSAGATGFSARRAMVDIEAIAKGPHTVWDQASLPPIRAYIKARLAELGLEPIVKDYPPITDGFGRSYPLQNIMARIPGKSGASILLVAHYDSSPKKRSFEVEGSRGAADDGYGLSTMFEVARLIKASGTTPENGLAFLFTDAEETGLWGARAEMEAGFEGWKDVNFVINLEARGVKGPAVMFETGRNNLASIELYRAAHWPFAYSFAVDVYRQMPNGTDFTAFLKRGFAGLNFAVLDDLSYYHTPRDNPSNVSLSSLQHYGEQIMPIVRAYTEDARYSKADAFVSKEDMVYFNWLPGVFLSYSGGFAGLLSLVVFLCFLAWFLWSLRAKRARLGSSLLWFLAWLGFAVASLALGLGASMLCAKLAGLPWKISYLPGVPGYQVIPWLALALELGLAWLVARVAQKRASSRDSALAGAMALNLLLLAVFHRFLPGGSFLFAIPVAVSLLAVLVARLAATPWLALAGPLFAISLFIPVLHLFDLALTLGALGLVLFLAALPIALAAPILADLPASTAQGDRAV